MTTQKPRCEICGEQLAARDGSPLYGGAAEMFDPNARPERDQAGVICPPAVICHAECGIGAGFEVA